MYHHECTIITTSRLFQQLHSHLLSTFPQQTVIITYKTIKREHVDLYMRVASFLLLQYVAR